jgi:guanylate cyclase
MINRTGCYDLKLTDTIKGFWPSENGSMPADEPYCGFRGQRCSYVFEIVMGSIVVACILMSLVIFIIYRYCQNVALNKMYWRIPLDDIRMIDNEQAKSLVSLGSANTKLSNVSVTDKKHAILGINTHCTYNKYLQRRPVKFGREDLKLLAQMKQARSLFVMPP